MPRHLATIILLKILTVATRVVVVVEVGDINNIKTPALKEEALEPMECMILTQIKIIKVGNKSQIILVKRLTHFSSIEAIN